MPKQKPAEHWYKSFCTLIFLVECRQSVMILFAKMRAAIPADLVLVCSIAVAIGAAAA